MKNMTFKKARELMGEAIFKDKALYMAYISNVAMLLWDILDENEGKLDYKGNDLVDKIADKILRLIFS